MAHYACGILFFAVLLRQGVSVCFFFNDTATTEIYTLSLHDALPIFAKLGSQGLEVGGELDLEGLGQVPGGGGSDRLDEGGADDPLDEPQGGRLDPLPLLSEERRLLPSL